MDQFLAKHAQSKKMNDPIVGVSKQVKQAKKDGTLKINATLGMLFDEAGAFLSYPTVDKVLASLSHQNQYTYAPTGGHTAYHSAVKHWVFGKQQAVVESAMHVGVVASAGGTGAISNTFSNYLNPQDAILVSDIAWVYKNIAKEYYLKTETYPLFTSGGQFNLEAMKKQALEIIKRQHRLVLVINDPCQNPTGYRLSESEWLDIIQFINDLSIYNSPVILLHDIAYIDYDPEGYDASRTIFKHFTTLKEHALVITAFSGSKTFSLYGLRIGAQIAMTKNPDSIESFTHANLVSSRAKWSNPPHIGISLVSELINNKTTYQSFKDELIQTSKVLRERGIMFMDYAKKHDIIMNPYKGGFFVTLPVKDADKVLKILNKNGVYAVALSGIIRISLSATNKTDIETVVKLLSTIQLS